MTDPSTELRARLTERRDLIARDIEELADQVDSGEIDEETATRLRAAYEEDLAEAEAHLQELPAASEIATDYQADEADETTGVSKKRILWGAGILVAAFTVVLVVLVSSAQTPSSTGAAAPAIDPSTATFEQMEAAVAANPNIIGMRIALADQYFETNDFSNALNHYLTVLDQSPSDDEASHVLGRVGWLAYVTGQSDAAIQYIDQALERDPSNLEATLFLGIVDLYGLEDPESAIPLLEQVLAEPNLPEQLRTDVESALQEAKSQVGG